MRTVSGWRAISRLRTDLEQREFVGYDHVGIIEKFDEIVQVDVDPVGRFDHDSHVPNNKLAATFLQLQVPATFGILIPIRR